MVAIVSGGSPRSPTRCAPSSRSTTRYANTLEVVDGRLTGEVLGPVVDRARKAPLLAEIAAREGVPLSQTVAVGDGANDLDMLAAAGSASRSTPSRWSRAQADATVSVPYLDAILFMLGIRGADVERQAADEQSSETERAA